MAMMSVGMAGAAGGMMGGQALLRMGILGASLAGSFLGGKNKEENSTKLNDLKVSSSAYGQGIPIIYGTMRTTGNMFWATDFVEVKRNFKKGGKKEVSGDKKKSDKKTEEAYEYYANFAMGLCAGPVKEVLRIWADSNLIYDKYGKDEDDVVSPGFSQQQNGGSSKKGGKQGKGKGGSGGDSGRFAFRFYSGSETQTADPFMVNTQGADNVPAHRGLCYLFFEDFALADFGNRTPTITAEVAVEPRQRVTGNQFVPIEYRNLNEGTSISAEPMGYPSMLKGDKFKIDVVNKRLYVSATNDSLIRVYDMNTFKEIKRIYTPDIGTASIFHATGVGVSYTPLFQTFSGADLGRFIGPTVTGNLLYEQNVSTNSRRIIEVDYNTLLPISYWGLNNSSTGISTLAMFLPDRVDHYAYADPTTGVLRYVTVICNIRGDMLYMDEFFRFIGYIENPFEYIGYEYDRVFVPGVNGEAAFYQVRTSIGGYELHYHSGQISGNGPLSIKVGNIDPNDVIVTQSDLYDLIYERPIDPLKGETRIYSVFAQYMVGPDCMAIIEDVVSDSTEHDGTFAVKMELLTGKVLWRKKMSDRSQLLSGSNQLQINTGNKFAFYQNGTVYEADFSQNSVNRYAVPSDAPDIETSGQTYYPLIGGILGYMSGDEYDDWGVLYVDRKAQYPASLVGIIQDICDKIGFEPYQVDVTELKDEEIAGFIIERPTPAMSVVQQLSDIFFFDFFESDNKLKFVSRGRDPLTYTPDVQIPQYKLGTVEEIGGGREFLKETRNQEIDIPQTVSFTFIDADNDYNTNTAHVRRPRSPLQNVHTREKLDVNVPIVLKPNEAKSIAHRLLYGLWSERITYDFHLSWEYLALDPTDVAEITLDDGYVFSARLAETDLGANYEIAMSGISHLNGTYSAEVKGAPAGGVIITNKTYPPSVRAVALDIPYLSPIDVDNSVQPEVYYGVAALGPDFRSAGLAYNVVNGDEGGLGGVISDLPWGTIVGMVPTPPNNNHLITDTVNEIILSPAFDFSLNDGMYEWESVDPVNWPNESNIIVIGKEIIKFRDVVENPDGTVTISHLIRGCRGTDPECYNHDPGEQWYIATTIGLNDKVHALSDLNKTISYSVQSGSFTSIGFATQFTLEGRSLFPWAPCAFKRNDISGDSTITWERRTRIGGELKDGSGTIPLAEDSEEYQVFILDSQYDPDTFDPGDSGTYLRVFEDVTTREVNYTSAMKTTDGKADDDPIHVVAYQISSYVGRGFPGWDTINLYAV